MAPALACQSLKSADQGAGALFCFEAEAAGVCSTLLSPCSEAERIRRFETGAGRACRATCVKKWDAAPGDDAGSSTLRPLACSRCGASRDKAATDALPASLALSGKTGGGKRPDASGREATLFSCSEIIKNCNSVASSGCARL